jgi:DNA-binding CsgD family transcriptional regulator
MRFGRTPAAAARLTTRERTVLALLVRGATCADVAGQLGLGLREVERHRADLIVKLDAMAQAGGGASGGIASAAPVSATGAAGTRGNPARRSRTRQ